MLRTYPDLEIRLDHMAGSSYSVDYRLTLPETDADVGASMQDPQRINIDLASLGQLELNHNEYGRTLTECVFTPKLREALGEAVTAAGQKNEVLRVRLFVGPTARELHSLRWETLLNPKDGSCLSMHERILFSRYIRTEDIRPFGLPPKQQLRALVVVANPNGLAKYQLAEIDVPAEIDRARRVLGAIERVELASQGKANLQSVLDHLRSGCDIFYLVCHGSFQLQASSEGLDKGESWLWLEKKDGGVARIPGRELIEAINQLPQLPRLVVLASCESAGPGSLTELGIQGALAALGPQLASAGVPAVVAMQGPIGMDTIELFLPTMFKELLDHGIIDLAVARARKVVQAQQDWWAPVLYSRLKSGRLWYAPGFGGVVEGQELKWPAVLAQIKRKKCTPIIGLGLCEQIFGSRHEIARQWAEAYGFPMSPYERDDFPRVSQYMATDQAGGFPRDELLAGLRKLILQRMNDEQRKSLGDVEVHELIHHVGSDLRKSAPIDSYKVLADLGLQIYVTTDPTDLLAQALRDAGRSPVVDYPRWHEDLENIEEYPSELKEEYEFEPTRERPLVFQLLGTLRAPKSLVVTEDNYFDFLIGFTKNRDLIPKRLRAALVSTGLLFTGFQLEEWNFRVVLRCLLSLGGKEMLRDHRHVCAQMDPNKISDPDGARRYLEKYFQTNTGPQVDVFWGSLEQFMEMLQKRWRDQKA